MICPLMSGRQEGMIFCELEDCAWYDEEKEECCIKILATQEKKENDING